MQTNPTRINLINTRKSRVIAKKGHSILKRKREVLVIEFLKLLKDTTHDRAHMRQILEEAYSTLTLSLIYAGDYEISYASSYVDEPAPIKIMVKDVMGVKVPSIERNEGLIPLQSRGYSILSTSSAIDDANEDFVRLLDAVVDLAKREQGLKRLVIEIEKVKRRVNALEYVLIPRLNRQARYISMRLEEMDRDTFSALKHVKKRLQIESK